jgi:hypothetical protein
MQFTIIMRLAVNQSPIYILKLILFLLLRFYLFSIEKQNSNIFYELD